MENGGVSSEERGEEGDVGGRKLDPEELLNEKDAELRACRVEGWSVTVALIANLSSKLL